jgi:hypothetical protein
VPGLKGHAAPLALSPKHGILRKATTVLDSGSHAVWLIARDYNSKHLKNRKMSFLHLSGAALTIWVSRNWTTDQIVTAAAAIARSWPIQPSPN